MAILWVKRLVNIRENGILVKVVEKHKPTTSLVFRIKEAYPIAFRKCVVLKAWLHSTTLIT